MDPLSVAMASFSAIKAGVAAGKEIHSLAKDIGQLWGAIDEIKSDHREAKTGMFASAEEEALTTFIAKKKAEDLEASLRQIVIATRGPSGWQELVKLRTEIKVRKQEEKRLKAQKAQELFETVLIGGTILILAIGLSVFFYFVWKSRHG